MLKGVLRLKHHVAGIFVSLNFSLVLVLDTSLLDHEIDKYHVWIIAKSMHSGWSLAQQCTKDRDGSLGGQDRE